AAASVRIEDTLANGGMLILKDNWKHPRLTTQKLPASEHYFTQVLPSRCRLDDNAAAELLTGTFYKLALVWDFDDKVMAGENALRPEEEVIVATESGQGVQGYTPSDMECFDFD